MKAELSIGEITQLASPLRAAGFLVSAVARLISGEEVLDVYLTTVTFIRNRQIITFAISREGIKREPWSSAFDW